MSKNKALVKLTYGELAQFANGDNGVTPVCECFAPLAYTGKVNYKNHNYDVFQAKECTCSEKKGAGQLIPFLDKRYMHVCIREDAWRDNPPDKALQKIHKLSIKVGKDPVYKLVTVTEGKNTFIKSVLCNEKETLEYYLK